MIRGFRLGRLVLILLALLSAGGCLNEPPTELGIWSEFLPLDDIRPHIPVLAEHEAELYLAVSPADINADLWDFLRAAQSENLTVFLWLQLPEEGTWLNEDNIKAFTDYARAVLEAAADAGLTLEWLIFDLEPSWGYAQELRVAAATGDIATLLDLFVTHHDPPSFTAATAELCALVDELHARDVRVMVATLPWTIDDLFDGDPDLQDIFDTPLAHIPWDRVSVMVYRPFLEDLFGAAFSPAVVTSYARSARAAFGSNVQVAIGNISTPGLLVPPGYEDPRELQRDLAAVTSAGVSSVSVFSLDGMVIAGGPERWLTVVEEPTRPVANMDFSTGLVRAGLRWGDLVAGW
ncbi:MAG: hypothetical protein ABIG44_01940 [Planctomycetota bacterium]